ncbi:hypothetical protein [Chitinophaga polysaccharea]|uniref:hypothetical protein n=1 Tax=Chitinophaga polysaccharea TaxID=1293035 RepID=UPI001157292E|nr:hypothetical protein [Chitinophaga polysaccharea]
MKIRSDSSPVFSSQVEEFGLAFLYCRLANRARILRRCPLYQFAFYDGADVGIGMKHRPDAACA